MDELMAIEKHIGTIGGTIGLQFAYVPEKLKDEDIKWEKFNEKKEAKLEVKEGEEGEAPPEEEVKKTGFNPEEF